MSQARNFIASLFAPKASDIAYTAGNMLVISFILRADSYKQGHPDGYPKSVKRRVVGMSAYGEARGGEGSIVAFGAQMWAKKMMNIRITKKDIDDAEAFCLAHFGRQLFNRKAWEKIVTEYNGYVPLIIRCVPEGTVMRPGLPIYTVTCLDEDLFWLAQFIETSILRGIWYPTTIASYDYDIKKEIKRLYELSGADLGLLVFALHDFGARGVSSGETAEIWGAAHLVNFMGSDTIEGILAANLYYKEQMAAYSVAATEHSIECSFKLDVEGEMEYLRNTIKQYFAPGAIISIVIDGKDVYRCAQALCCDPELKQLIIELSKIGGKVVFRPDSGDMMETVPRILQLQEAAFGSTVNAKGFKKVNCVGIIQGDGIDRRGLAIKSLLGKIIAMGYAADCVIFGSGGGLLQSVTRDDKKFAQKASAILVRYEDGSEEWEGIAKDPVTDPGKKSKEGVMTTVRSRMTGELSAARLDQFELNEEFEDIMILIYYYGQFFNETTLAQVRERASV
jgi:nicotinamide phosphoribosyltransferase